MHHGSRTAKPLGTRSWRSQEAYFSHSSQTIKSQITISSSLLPSACFPSFNFVQKTLLHIAITWHATVHSHSLPSIPFTKGGLMSGAWGRNQDGLTALPYLLRPHPRLERASTKVSKKPRMHASYAASQKIVRFCCKSQNQPRSLE